MSKKEMINTIKGLFDKPFGAREVKRIEKGLEDVVFVEELIGIIIKNTKKYKNIDKNKAKELYLILNDLRFELEYEEQKEDI